jgi:hypothetical protein
LIQLFLGDKSRKKLQRNQETGNGKQETGIGMTGCYFFCQPAGFIVFLNVKGKET